MISRPVVSLAASATAVLAMSSLAACSDDPDAMPAASAATSATDPTPTPTESAEPTEPVVSEVATGSVTSDQIADLFTTAMGSISTADVSMSMESTAAGAMTIEGEIDMTKTPADISMSMDMSSMGFGMVDALMVDGTGRHGPSTSWLARCARGWRTKRPRGPHGTATSSPRTSSPRQPCGGQQPALATTSAP